MAAVALLLTGCQQSDQTLPFDLADDDGAALTIGVAGGTVSVPPSFSIQIPAGALGSSVNVAVTPRIDVPFPDDEGSPVPGTAFDIGPVGTALTTPARIDLAVDPALLEAGEDVRLSLALVRQDGSVETFQGAFDVTNGVLSAEVDELGPVAAVVSADAVPVTLDAPAPLNGGAFPQPPPPGPSGPAPASYGGVEFIASCAPDERRCFSSGVVRLWADGVVRDRLGDDIFLLDPSVEATLEFISFDVLTGLPTEIVGSVSVNGQLRARLNSTVTRRTVDDGVTTGLSTEAAPTMLDVSGNVLVIAETTTEDGSFEFDEELEYAITGIGTSDMLIVEIEAELEFENEDGTFDTGILTAHLRLRR